ncbi:OLC1v1000970C1 [Oldenlandia corymbosa var. corymbosa]|uniref:Dihydroflavonol 4-reductase n=1 Tax=Oldenlandia corymbosa var. corymbosa TaxID=529605 RepID=A0AAV1D516_OLDCO|nr:OLC1v1000970C1 [Oldenlandia corymbosa var. corymbosa]
MEKKEGEVVCVTGGSGYIGSFLISLLLQRGYSVHATVKDLKDEKETKHLVELEGAESRLRLFQIDLLNYESILAAVTGTTGVFHLASPCIIDEVGDPQAEVVEPAIKGTINVLSAAKELGVLRVVVTSSTAAIYPNPSWPSDKVMNEECWTDEGYCRGKGAWYSVSKTLAEKAAWEFAKEKGLDIVVVNPGFAKDTLPGLLRAKDASKKLIDLGLNFIPMEQIIKESVESLKMKGFLP